MGRILYIVAREQPLLCGYLMAKVDARSPDGHSVEIKLDERRGERRRESTGRAPERRRSEQRRQPSLYGELRSRGYATVLQHEDIQSRAGVPLAEPAPGWRPRSTRGQRAARAWRRNGVRWALRAGVLLAALALWIVVARSIHPTANSSGTMAGFRTAQPAPRVEEEFPLPSTSPIDPASPPHPPARLRCRAIRRLESENAPPSEHGSGLGASAPSRRTPARHPHRPFRARVPSRRFQGHRDQLVRHSGRRFRGRGHDGVGRNAARAVSRGDPPGKSRSRRTKATRELGGYPDFFSCETAASAA